MTVEQLAEKLEALRQIRSPWETLWQDISTYVMPRRAYSLGGTLSPSTQKESLLFDTTAVQANMTLANGCVAWMSPLESAWFAFEPTTRQKAAEAKRYLSDATTTIRSALAVSNFYVGAHEFYLDRGAFGTSAIYVEPGRKSKLNVQCWPVGSFVIETDDEGNVDTVIREFTLTARAAVKKFGFAKLSKKSQEAFTAGGAKAMEQIKFAHAIYPREERDEYRLDAGNMPIASCYWECENKQIVQEGGYEEMPVMVSRYLEWGAGYGHVYGWAPSFAALPEARQVNFMQKMMDALAEKMAFPPMLVPDDLDGLLDQNANGITYFSKELAQTLPRPLQENNRYDIGLQRIQERQKAIDRAFHVDLFSMFAQLDKVMTAREVMERSSEKLIQFSPTFARLTGEFFNPFLQRVFGIGLRNGWIDEPPQSMQMVVGKGDVAYVEPPEIQYSSRIALALRSLPMLAYQRMLERLAVLAPLVPSVLDLYDFDEAERQTSLNDGVPADFILKEDDVDKNRQARAAQQQQQAQMEQAATAAKAAGDVGKIPPESPVGQIIQAQFPKGQSQVA